MSSFLHTSTPPDPDRAYVVSTTRIRVKSPRAALTLLRRLGPVQTQLRAAPGLVVFGLRAQLLRLTFSTYGVFDDRRALAAFVRSGAHAEAMQVLSGRIARFESRLTTVAGTDLPTDWSAIHDHLSAAEPARPAEPRAEPPGRLAAGETPSSAKRSR